MDSNGLHPNDLDFLTLQKAFPPDGGVVLPTCLDWNSQYSNDSQFLSTTSHESFSSSTTTIGTNTPAEDFFWEPTVAGNEAESVWYQDGSQRRWPNLNLVALPDNQATFFAHPLRHTSLSEDTCRSLSSSHKSSCDLSQNQQVEPSKSNYMESENTTTATERSTHIPHMSLTVSKSCKRKPTNANTTRSDAHGPVKKTAHNMIEKRYRNKLNDSIAELRDTIPSLRLGGSGMANESSPKLYKATVITKAVEHILSMEKDIKRLMDEVRILGSQNERLKTQLTSGGGTLHPPSK